MGADGKPLAIQPAFEIDPRDPTNVVAVLPSGDTYDPPAYEFPPFRVHLEYPEGSARGAAAPTPIPIAVDEEGVPLAVQPHLEVDPTNHAHVTATFSDLTTAPVEVQQMSQDFFVFVEASGPSSEHGSVSFVAVAVDASGTPLPIQPHFEDLDPADLTKVKAVFPDGSVYEPPPLYPPSGMSTEQWPPEQWPPVEEEPTEEDPSEETGAESTEVADAEQADDEASTADAADTTEEEIPVATGGTDDSDGATAADSSVRDGENDSTSVADDAVSVDMEEELLTAGLVDDVSRGEESVTRITLPDVAVPVGGDELPVTPITLPDVAVPVGGEEVSVPPIPFAEPPPMGDVGAGDADAVGATDDTIALDRTDNDLPVDVGDEGTPEADAIEFHVVAIEEVQVEAVRVEDAASVAIEEPESIAEYEDAPPEVEGFDDLDGQEPANCRMRSDASVCRPGSLSQCRRNGSFLSAIRPCRLRQHRRTRSNRLRPAFGRTTGIAESPLPSSHSRRSGQLGPATRRSGPRMPSRTERCCCRQPPWIRAGTGHRRIPQGPPDSRLR